MLERKLFFPPKQSETIVGGSYYVAPATIKPPYRVHKIFGFIDGRRTACELIRKGLVAARYIARAGNYAEALDAQASFAYLREPYERYRY